MNPSPSPQNPASAPCAEVEPDLSAYLDAELPAAVRSRVERHVAACAACASELQRLRRVSGVLRRWDAQETAFASSPGFRNRVAAQVGLGHAGPAAPPRRLLSAPFWTAAAAAAVVATVASLSSSHRSGWLANGGAQDDAATETADLRDEALVRERAARTEWDRVRTASAARRAAGDPVPLSLPAVEPFERGIGDAPAAESPAAAQRAEVWESMEEGLLLHDARSAYDEYLAERRRLVFEERIAQRIASAREPEGSGATVGRGTAASGGVAAQTPLASWIGSLRVSETKWNPYEHVQVWPIEAPGAAFGSSDRPGERPQDRMLTAADAMERRLLRVRDDGDEVVASNDDVKQRSVLLLAGDVIHGLRRDRVVREDVLLAPGRSMIVPTFGSGRERERSGARSYSSSPLVAPVGLRALFGAATLGVRVSQGDVDDIVRASVTGLASPSGQGSLFNLAANAELQRELNRSVEVFRKRLERNEVVGFAVSAGSRLIAVELCGDVESFRASRDRLLRSHLLAVLQLPAEELAGRTPEDAEVSAALQVARRAVYDDSGAAGDGTLTAFRTVGGDVFGYGILQGSRVVHAVVFASGVQITGAGSKGRIRDLGGAAGGAAPAASGGGSRDGPGSADGDGGTVRDDR